VIRCTIVVSGAVLRRRQFIALIGSGLGAWPLATYAQQPGEMRRIAVLLALAETDPEAQDRVKSIQQGMRELGWIEGRNIRIDYRFAAGRTDRIQRYISELVAAAPEVILVNSTPVTTALHQATRTIPIVFAQMIDPVAGGVAQSLAKPGGNVTGLMDFEFAIVGKWLELLKEVVPKLTHVSVLWAQSITYAGLVRETDRIGPRLGLRVASYDVSAPAQFEAAISETARDENGALVVLPTPQNSANRDLISALAIRHRLPMIAGFRFFAVSGNLMSYGASLPELYRRSAFYVDRILKGEKPADLPIQGPTKFEFVINLKTAKMLGLNIPPFLQQRADEVIE
jgi:putative tryptophan/tyrosine transport system substrate-binding protein